MGNAGALVTQTSCRVCIRGALISSRCAAAVRLCKNILHFKDVGWHYRQRHMDMIVILLVPNISVLRPCLDV